MSARDDYPYDRHDYDMWRWMCDELDQLRARVAASDTAIADLVTGAAGVTDLGDMT